MGIVLRLGDFGYLLVYKDNIRRHSRYANCDYPYKIKNDTYYYPFRWARNGQKDSIRGNTYVNHSLYYTRANYTMMASIIRCTDKEDEGNLYSVNPFSNCKNKLLG